MSRTRNACGGEYSHGDLEERESCKISSSAGKLKWAYEKLWMKTVASTKRPKAPLTQGSAAHQPGVVGLDWGLFSTFSAQKDASSHCSISCGTYWSVRSSHCFEGCREKVQVLHGARQDGDAYPQERARRTSGGWGPSGVSAQGSQAGTKIRGDKRGEIWWEIPNDFMGIKGKQWRFGLLPGLSSPAPRSLWSAHPLPWPPPQKLRLG